MADEATRHDRLQLDRPHGARVYDYFLGGKDNFAVDRQAAEHLLDVMCSLWVGVAHQAVTVAVRPAGAVPGASPA